ncbi:MAG: hypothetical protein A2X49_10905 [Lentisphaerae bacterium GWF2_52_8]|nr:MAG: hypothetical protein A2X49_10905 [Lentisphaerae bacterium GWF2_52_8]
MIFSHNFDFDPACGYSEEELLKIKQPTDTPADFSSFWRDTYKEALVPPTKITKRRIWSPSEAIEAWELFFDSWEGVRIGAWIARPLAGSKGGIVLGHGYGTHIFGDMSWAEKGFTCISLCIRGFSLSAHETIPWSVKSHVLHRIESRDQYVLRGAVADIWRAASAMLELYPDTSANLCYCGSSFGGGLGALSIPWDPRFRAAYWDVPTFGHHSLRMKFKSHGSGEAVRLYAQEHPEVSEVLRYYDAASSAGQTRIPVICSVALFDPTVVPPGQFAVANALPQPPCCRIIVPGGHYGYPEHKGIYEGIAAKVLTLFEKC